jgi:broad specificity phosphatase PhoE
MNVVSLKDQLIAQLWDTVDHFDYIRSATLTGSFVESETLEGISDIDFVVIVDHLNAFRFKELQERFTVALRPVLRQHGYDFQLNPTLGPLKFNAPRLAVLHLMLYSVEAHVEHVINSPFTCLDWQRSGHVRKESMGEVYPVFGLQPHHFMSGRRSLKDYLRDFHAGVVSYRELFCDEDGYTETKRARPMDCRDRHEFAYHICKFLMRNLHKLITRSNQSMSNDELLDAYFAIFPESWDAFGAFFHELSRKKQHLDFNEALPDLDTKLEAFVTTFERQFRATFFDTATYHVVFRHAATDLNRGAGDQRRYQGRIDSNIAPLEPSALALLQAAVDANPPTRVFTSPLRRCRQSLARLAEMTTLPQAEVDDRLSEIDYGAIDGLRVAEAKERYPDLFEAWARGEDPRHPGGENLADVVTRLAGFIEDRWQAAEGATLTATHNVGMRCLIGSTLGVPRPLWYRMQVPHLAPLTFIQTRKFGLFVDIPEEVERPLFSAFVSSTDERDRPCKY